MKTKSIFSIFMLFCSMTVFAQSNVSSNKEAIRIFIEDVWTKKQFDKLEALLADSVIFHVNNFYTPSGNTETTIGSIKEWHTAFPDFKYVVLNIIGEENYVAANLRFTGTHKSQFMGMDPQNNAIDVTELMMFRFKNKRIVEIWSVWDYITMRLQMLKSK